MAFSNGINVAVYLVVLAVVAYVGMSLSVPDISHKILSRNVETKFTCEGRSYGYYADTFNNCQIFHVCVPEEDPNTGQIFITRDFSFVCGNDTIFDQTTLTCEFTNEALPCSEAEGHYLSSNKNFGEVEE